MSNRTKRVYNSESRDAQAAQTKSRILKCARKLFQSKGFEGVTIEKIAQSAQVSAPTIYALFQSKRGVLRVLIDESFSSDEFHKLVEITKQEISAQERLVVSAKIVREMYDAEQSQMDIFRGASVLAPEFRELEREREERRYVRQGETVKRLAREKLLKKGLSTAKARDILWALTGRDMYRMFVIERKWSSKRYEKWLSQLLIMTLLNID